MFCIETNLVLCCSHDNFQSFRYNDINKEQLMSHKFCSIFTASTIYVL